MLFLRGHVKGCGTLFCKPGVPVCLLFKQVLLKEKRLLSIREATFSHNKKSIYNKNKPVKQEDIAVILN